MSSPLSSRLIPIILLSLITASACFCQLARADILEKAGLSSKPALYEFRYRIQGSEEDKTLLKPKMKEAKTYLESRDVPDNIDDIYIRHKATQDQQYLTKILQSQGYFKAEVEMDYQEEPEKRATFTAIPGPRYFFQSITLEPNPTSPTSPITLKLPEEQALKAMPDGPAVAAYVYEDEKTIRSWVEENNCLFEHKVEHRAIINHLTRKVDIIYRINYGAKARFGGIEFTGNDEVSDLYLRRHIEPTNGDCFTRDKLDKLKATLINTGLFGSVEAQIPDKPLPSGKVPVTMKLTGGEHRTIKAGASFSTDIGPGITLGWEHRNFFGNAEKFNADLTLTPLERRLSSKLKKPYFWGIDQNLTLGASIFQKDNDAYRSDGFELSANIDRTLENGWNIAAGVGYGFEQIEDQNGEENVALLRVPLNASRDERNNVLNPTEGYTLKLSSTPAFDTIDINSTFIKNQGSGTIYHSLSDSENYVLAGRLATGGIAGSSTDGIPASERFYVGGANSIRGYAYQSGGPLDSQNDPLGGRSFVEISTELRTRFAEDYGAVLFLDGGNVFDEPIPQFTEEMLWGAGIGFRYFTSFGPIRADVAFPLNRRDNVDDAFQLYFSIGQAF